MATIDASVPLPPTMIEGATLVFCLNGMCASGAIGAAPTMIPLAGPSPYYTMCGGVTTAADGTAQLEVQVSCGGTCFKDGDLYTATIVNTQSSLLYDGSRAVNYMDRQACGETCKSATATLNNM